MFYCPSQKEIVIKLEKEFNSHHKTYINRHAVSIILSSITDCETTMKKE